MLRTMTTLTTIALLTTTACVTEPDTGTETEDTELYRAALVSGDDVALDTEGVTASGVRGQALAGDPSHVARLTADAVVNTNALLQAHFDLLKEIVALPPTVATPDSHIWQGDHQGKTFRIAMTRKEAPRGVRFEYIFAGKDAAAADDAFKPLLSGHVTRIETRPRFDKQGWGVLRIHFTNLNELDPAEHPSTGIARVAFRRVGNVHQVDARLLNLQPPNEPDFPKAAAYQYTLLPRGAGAMRWYSKQDVMMDGAPLEDVVVHSAWRRDKSGVGHAVVANGSLNVEGTPVDYWSLVECWDSNFINGFERHAVPGFEKSDGMPSACWRPTDQLELPEAQETLPDEDPAVPGAHPEEVEGDTEF